MNGEITQFNDTLEKVISLSAKLSEYLVENPDLVNLGIVNEEVSLKEEDELNLA